MTLIQQAARLLPAEVQTAVYLIVKPCRKLIVKMAANFIVSSEVFMEVPGDCNPIYSGRFFNLLCCSVSLDVIAS